MPDEPVDEYKEYEDEDEDINLLYDVALNWDIESEAIVHTGLGHLVYSKHEEHIVI